MAGDYITLMGADDVKSAGYTMRAAAMQMQQAASSIEYVLGRHEQFLDDWLLRFESALDRLTEVGE